MATDWVNYSNQNPCGGFSSHVQPNAKAGQAAIAKMASLFTTSLIEIGGRLLSKLADVSTPAGPTPREDRR